jgi:hypothetical protein
MSDPSPSLESRLSALWQEYTTTSSAAYAQYQVDLKKAQRELRTRYLRSENALLQRTYKQIRELRLDARDVARQKSKSLDKELKKYVARASH